MNELEVIKQKIFIIRGQRVILDRDLAELYQVTTSHLNRQVERNIDRFPAEFMLILSEKDIDDLRCQNGIANLSSKSRYLPHAFTELGIYKLSSVLKSDIAKEIDIQIYKVFKEMKDALSSINNFQAIVENISDKQTQTILKQVFSYMENKNLNQQININSPNSVMANNNAELRSIMVNNQLNNSSLTQLLDTFEQDLNSIIMPDKGKKEILDGIQELKTLIKNPS